MQSSNTLVKSVNRSAKLYHPPLKQLSISSSVLARGAKMCLFTIVMKSRYRIRGARIISDIIRLFTVLIRSILFSPIVTRNGVITLVTIAVLTQRNTVILKYRLVIILPSSQCFSKLTKSLTMTGMPALKVDRMTEYKMVLTFVRACWRMIADKMTSPSVIMREMPIRRYTPRRL